MSTTVFDTGSVVSFTPERFEIETWKGDSQGPVGEWAVETEKAFGWALVVTHRDNYVLDTEVQPMIVCCGSLVPVLYHLNGDHADKGELYWWRMGL